MGRRRLERPQPQRVGGHHRRRSALDPERELHHPRRLRRLAWGQGAGLRRRRQHRDDERVRALHQPRPHLLAVAWYDWFASFYDASVEGFYRDVRQAALEQLRPDEGATVLVLACGTGQDFGAVAPAVGDAGRVIGLDFSPGMLKKAQKRITKRGWDNVSLVEADARTVSAEQLEAAVGEPVQLDGVLICLGMSVLPDWEQVFQQAWDMLRPGGRFVIFDVYADSWVPQTSWVKLIAQADMTR
ncbi:MAG: methyltransferase domain-containing protein, partial [Proteobacteria bacterium]|nr:methyltransferase domain-containing protein [Pseudomonadota bacterium]